MARHTMTGLRRKIGAAPSHTAHAEMPLFQKPPGPSPEPNGVRVGLGGLKEVQTSKQTRMHFHQVRHTRRHTRKQETFEVHALCDSPGGNDERIGMHLHVCKYHYTVQRGCRQGGTGRSNARTTIDEQSNKAGQAYCWIGQQRDAWLGRRA
jgi:hypothetical protein